MLHNSTNSRKIMGSDWSPCAWPAAEWLPPGCHPQWDQESPSCWTSGAASAPLPEARCGKLPAPSPGLPDSPHVSGPYNAQNVSPHTANRQFCMPLISVCFVKYCFLSKGSHHGSITEVSVVSFKSVHFVSDGWVVDRGQQSISFLHH